MTKGSKPLNFVNGSTSGIDRGVIPATDLEKADIWSGVVPQHPPTILTNPDSENSWRNPDI